MTGSRETRIRGLDGLRAASIGLVIASHAIGTTGFPWPDFGSYLGDLGDLGVRVFFVISGFLITTLLLREARTGSISLKAFYIRRALRILPAFWCFLGVVVLLIVAGAIEVWPGDLQHALTFTMNYHTERSWYVGHVWSLSVEEQFYLLWPALLFVFGFGRGTLAAAAAMLIAPLVRLLTYWLFPEHERLIHQMFPATMDSIAAGCLYACAIHYAHAHDLKDHNRPFVRSGAFALGCVAFAFLCNYLSSHPWFKYALGASLMNLCIVGVIDFVVHAQGAWDRWLNWRPIAYVGTLSYSLYLWQQLFMNSQSRFVFCRFPLNVIASVAVAALSYHVVEQPFLRLRSRFRGRVAAPRHAPPIPATVKDSLVGF